MHTNKGSNRTPGSNFPHVEIRDEHGTRIDPSTSQPTTRTNPSNHTEIEYDI